MQAKGVFLGGNFQGSATPDCHTALVVPCHRACYGIAGNSGFTFH